MKVVLTCGHPFSGYEQVHAALVKGGMMEAQASHREGLTPQALHERMARVFDTGTGGPVSQIAPGKVWESLAVDLFLSNLDHQCWGWADSRLAWFLDFWAGFDPQVRFTLVYCTPEAAAARALCGGVATADALQQALASWVEMQTALLRFYHRHRERCLLVNVDAVVRAPEAFLGKVNEHFELSLNYESMGEVDSDSPSPLSTLLLSSLGLYGEDTQATALLRELEAIADLPDGESKVNAFDPAAAVAEYGTLMEKLDRIAELQQREALLAESSQRAAASSELMSVQSALAEERAKNAELSEEGELLLLQLHQVQEELERYYLQVQELQGKGNAATGYRGAGLPSPMRPVDLTFDLRRDIEGENWWDAEPDGRWAGPESVSTLTLPPLAAGRYEVLLDVMDAMAPEVLNGMQVALNGRPISLEAMKPGLPTLVIGRFAVDEGSLDAHCKLELRFPGLQSPAELGTNPDDHRRLAIRLRSVRVSALDTGLDATVTHSHAADLVPLGLMDATIDLRKDLQGNNWWDAEPDGRWAGPERVSSLTMPALGQGRYQFQLKVVDAMSPEILSGMQVALNGQPIAVESTRPGYPTLVVGQFEADEVGAEANWTFELKFPSLVSPAELGNNAEDRRPLAIRVRSLRIGAVDTDTDAVPRPRRRPFFWRRKKRGAGGRKSH